MLDFLFYMHTAHTDCNLVTFKNMDQSLVKSAGLFFIRDLILVPSVKITDLLAIYIQL